MTTDSHSEKTLLFRAMLEKAGLRPTPQRMGLLRLLFADGDRHVTAQAVHLEAARLGLPLSQATAYNALNQLCQAGVLREVNVDPGRVYYDTRTDPHAHLYDVDTGELEDVDMVAGLPDPVIGPDREVVAVDLTWRVRRH